MEAEEVRNEKKLEERERGGAREVEKKRGDMALL